MRQLRFRILSIGSFLATIACHGAAPAAPVPSDLSRSPFRQPLEETAIASADEGPIYQAALAFYRPGPGQGRWLDRRLLPEAPTDTTGSLAPELAQRLVDALGPDRFCLQDQPARCAQDHGGILRVSRPYGRGPDEVRLAVLFTGVPGPYAPGTGVVSTLIFLLQRDARGWHIRSHFPASPADAMPSRPPG